jgi:hypothetical protein
MGSARSVKTVLGRIILAWTEADGRARLGDREPLEVDFAFTPRSPYADRPKNVKPVPPLNTRVANVPIFQKNKA